MTNEIVAMPEVGIDYQPARLSIKDKDIILANVEEYVEKYQGTIATEDTLKGDKKVLADLRKMKKAFETKRISVKKEFNVPYEKFADDIEEICNPLDEVVDSIDKSIKGLEAKQKEERKRKALEIINQLAPQYDIDPDEVEFDSKWTNKIPLKKVEELITETLTSIKRKNKAIQVEQKLVSEHAKLLDIDSAGWISQVNEEFHADDVIKAMDAHIEELKQKEIREEKRKESEAAIKKAEQEANQTQVGDKVIDMNTGEVVEPTQKIYKLAIELTGTQANLISAIQTINKLAEQQVTNKIIHGLTEVE